MKLIKNFLSHAFEATWKTKLLTDWPTIMGNLADKVTVEKMYDDSLVLGVHDSNWLHELYMLSPVLIKTINSHLEKPYIKTVRLKHASTIKKQPIANKPIILYQAPPPVTLTFSEKKALDTVNDHELKQAFHIFLSRCRQDAK